MLQIHDVWDLINKQQALTAKQRTESRSLFQRLGVLNKNFLLHFFIVVVLELTLVSIFVKIHDVYFPNLDVYSHAFAWAYLTVVAAPMVYLIYRHHIPHEYLGIRFKHLFKSSFEASLITIVLASAIYFYTSWGWQKFTEVLFTPWAAIYILHAYIQEIIARGMLQGILCRMMDDYQQIYPIALASLIFSLFHLQFGLDAVVVTFFAGIALGFIYQRQQNLIGVTIIHGVIGWLAFNAGLL